MIFALYGLVRHKGKKIANGINGRFETDSPRIIALLKQKGFKEIVKQPKEGAYILAVQDGNIEKTPLVEKRRRGRPKKEQ